jgi:hypothetical protein
MARRTQNIMPMCFQKNTKEDKQRSNSYFSGALDIILYQSFFQSPLFHTSVGNRQFRFSM